jgi:cation diffusion facilitator family transporter
VLLATSGFIIGKALVRLYSGATPIRVTWYSIAVLIVSIAVDFSRSRVLRRVARQTKSQALEADALNFSSDILSSLVVLAGLVFVSMGITRADAVAAIVVALLVAYAAVKLGRKTVDVLIDAAPEGVSERIAEAARATQGVISVDKIRVKPAGPFSFVEMTVKVSRTLSQEQVRLICDALENRVRGLLPGADITINTRPVALDRETITERVYLIGLNHNMHVHNISSSIKDTEKCISFDVEVDHNLTINEAHEAVSGLERDIRREFGGGTAVSAHIDPLWTDELRSHPLPPGEEDGVRKVISGAADTIEGIREVHDIKISKTDGGRLFITLHCSFEGGMLLEDVHSITSRLERIIHQCIPNAQRVIVHAEPPSARE